MRKYRGPSLPPNGPTIIRALPELHYPERLNIARALLEGALAKGFGPRVAYHCNGRRFTYAVVHREVHRYADALRRLGVREGEAVVLRQDDSAELIFSILAVQAIGAIAVPTYTQLRAQDLVYRVNDCGAGAHACRLPRSLRRWGAAGRLRAQACRHAGFGRFAEPIPTRRSSSSPSPPCWRTAIRASSMRIPMPRT